MKLSDIFSQLAYGELSQLALVDQDTGLINVTKYAPVVAHVNLGLTALYKRFTLKEGRLVIKLKPSQTRYLLRSDEDIAGEDDEEFNDDILKVEKVITDTGLELGLNDSSDPYGCTTPSSTVLRVPLIVVNKGPDLPKELLTSKLQVVYHANHPKVVAPASAPGLARISIELPDTHLEPLLLYIASRVHNPVGMTNEMQASNSWYAKYEAACARLEQDGLEVDTGSQNTRARRGGWV